MLHSVEINLGFEVDLDAELAASCSAPKSETAKRPRVETPTIALLPAGNPKATTDGNGVDWEF